jgi:hypothetical protein
MRFLEPKLGKNCMNLVKKLLPAGHLTIIMISLVIRINGYQSFDGTQDKSQIKSAPPTAGKHGRVNPPEAGKGVRKWF